MSATFEEFSGGYYIGRLRVTSFNGSQPVLPSDQLQHVRESLYDDQPPREEPIVMKIGRLHFPVHGETAVPAGTLGVPEAIQSELDIHLPKKTQVFLAKPGQARELLKAQDALPASADRKE